MLENILQHTKTAIEVTQYLMENGFTPGAKSEYSDTNYFFKDDTGIMITGDTVDFGTFNPEINGKREPGCKIHASYSGVHNLDLRQWKMLLDITNMVKLEGIVLFEND
jgi:hypothetical protein